MCGIFGFILRKPMSMGKVFKTLKKLETSRYPDETDTLGGYGAGIALMLPGGGVIVEKVGKITGSPVMKLEEILKNKTIMNAKITRASILLGHVRFPSSEHFDTVKYREAAQPYVGSFKSKLTVVSIHNGKVENFDSLKAKVEKHIFESEKLGFIDSEVIPHYFGELLSETGNQDVAVYELFSTLQGSGNAVALLQVDEENAFLHLIYKGKAEGLTVWTNDRGEVIFCSRSEPVEEVFKELLAIDKFKEKVVINRKDDAGLKLSFPAIFE